MLNQADMFEKSFPNGQEVCVTLTSNYITGELEGLENRIYFSDLKRVIFGHDMVIFQSDNREIMLVTPETQQVYQIVKGRARIIFIERKFKL